MVKKILSACFATSAVKENRVNAVIFGYVGNHQFLPLDATVLLWYYAKYLAVCLAVCPVRHTKRRQA